MSSFVPNDPCAGTITELVTGPRGGICAHIEYDDGDTEDIYLHRALPLILDRKTKNLLAKALRI